MNLRDRISAAIDEDLGPGDLTTEPIIPPTQIGRAELIAKQPVVVSGQRFVRSVFDVVGQRLGAFAAYKPEKADGEVAAPGELLGVVSGNMRAILIGERPALNLAMRAAGIATHVRSILDHVGPATFRAVDTRKTTPLWRDLEKEAVVHGGGHNHRFGLFDGVLIKDNHIAAAGGVEAAVSRVRAGVHHLVKIEVEVTSLDELHEALAAGADGVLLDNMDDATMAAAVAIVDETRPGAFVEASGNMDAERMKAIAAIGLDVVSVGGFIHQARWADLSLKVR
jgi:nicotinate-nucleotide pyrophosphorylase (carboxylating)